MELLDVSLDLKSQWFNYYKCTETQNKMQIQQVDTHAFAIALKLLIVI